jgi:DNA helicase-2/ATP-dependent DNA helicase PcrA
MLTLAEAQQRAVAHGDGPLLLQGAAGTGKTEALARRFARLAGDGVAPDRILVLARTRATARRLRRRVEAFLDSPHGELWIGTWDELAERILRDYSTAAGLDPFFDVLGPAERLAILLDRLDDLPLRNREIRGNPAGLLARLLDQIDELKTRSDPPEPELAELCAAHDRILAERGSLDAADVFLVLNKLLHERADVRAEIATRFAHLMVDEYEDTTSAQRTILSKLAEENPNHLYALEVRDEAGEAPGVSSPPHPRATRGQAATFMTSSSAARWWTSSSDSGNRRCDFGGAATSERKHKPSPARSSTCSARGSRPRRSAC